jgi:hypothetical protein
MAMEIELERQREKHTHAYWLSSLQVPEIMTHE